MVTFWILQKPKILHTFKVLCEWPSAREQLILENMYHSELGIHLGQKLQINQQFNASNVYKKIGSMSGAIKKRFWNGMDHWMNFQ